MIFSAITASTLLSLTLTVASVAYQRNQARKLKNELDKRKQVNVAIDGEPFYLPIVYGRGKVAGGKVFHSLRDSFTFAGPEGSGTAREPTSGYNYSLTGNTYYIKESSTTLFNISSFLTSGLFEAGIKTEIFWNGVKIFERENSSSVSSFIDSNNRIYEKGPLVLVDSIIFSLSTPHVRYYRVARKSALSAAVFSSEMDSSISGSKKEYLLVQQAIAFGGLNKIVDVEVDDKLWDEEKLKHGQRIHAYLNGGVSDPMATANGAPSTNLFTNTAYASMVFRLNRDEYNYNGSPNVTFFVEGMRVYDLLETSGVYSLSSTKIFTTNPALVMLDYLMSPIYGRGLSLDKLDLATFYNAKSICNRVVKTDVAIDGKVNGRRPDVEDEDGNITTQPALPSRDLPLYECNVVLDSERSIRENIEIILESMPNSDLIWSGGKYKLVLSAPRTEEDIQDLIVATIGTSDIIREQVDLSWPDSSARLNQATVRFKSEFENFADDTVTWPTTYSPVYNTYIAEDSGQVLTTDEYLSCTTDPYHALAKAEELVRESRRSMRAKMTIGKKGLLLEPGDLVLVNAPSTGLVNELMKVTSVAVSANMTAALELVQFDLGTFAWNVSDELAYLPKLIFYQSVPRPTQVVFTPTGVGSLLGVSSGQLAWLSPDDITVSEFVVEASVDSGTTWSTLGTSTTSSFTVQGLNSGVYKFAVRSKKTSGELSKRAIATNVSITADSFSLTRETSERVLIVYANTANAATNTQSTVLVAQQFVAYYVYSGNTPTLPIRTAISFVRFAGTDGAVGPRGPGLWRYDTGADNLTVLTSVGVNTYFATATGLTPVEGDRFVIATTHVSGTKAYLRVGSAWTLQSAFIDGNLLVSGTVTADRLNTSSLSTAGLAVFGGALQSTGYLPGAAGWRIANTGDAELNSLTVRANNIENGAVSSKAIQAIASASVSRDSPTTLLTMSIPATTSTSFILVGLRVTLKKVLRSGISAVAAGTFQRRVRVGSVWQDWEDLPINWSAPANVDNAEKMTTYSDFLIGAYNGAEYRLLTTGMSGSGLPTNSTGLIGDCSIVRQEILK